MGHYGSQALYVAAKLRLADLLADAPMTAGALAAAVDADPDALGRVLRLLVRLGIFEMDAEGRLSLNAASQSLRTLSEGSMRDLVEVYGDEFYRAFGNLLHTVLTGRDAFRATFGAGLFEYLEAHPERARTFDRAMAAGSVFFRAIPQIYDFSLLRTVVDVGGGNGALLAAILQENPHLEGILFDSPSVAEAARASPHVTQAGNRLRVVAGDFFESIVPGGDAYVFSRILHDWSDEQCLTILRNCRAAVGPGGRVLIVERLLPGAYATYSDVTMLAVTEGRERSREEFASMLRRTGFELSGVVPLPLEANLIEGLAV